MDIIKKIKLNALETISELSIKELEEIIVYVADKYYNTSISIIDDATLNAPFSLNYIVDYNNIESYPNIQKSNLILLNVLVELMFIKINKNL